jgi:uncharacterized RDD family membrane protein YckC
MPGEVATRPGLWRRTAARCTEIFLYGSLLAIGHELLGRAAVRAPGFDLLVVLLYFADHLIVARLRGQSVAQWVCGYQIVRLDGGRPTLLQQLVRSTLFGCLGTLSLVSSMPFRRDRAALHDLLTRTRTLRTTAWPRRRLRRAGLALGAATLSTLYLTTLVEELFGDRIVKREDEWSASPPIETPALALASPVTLPGVAILAAHEDVSTRVCALAEPDHYRLEVGSEAFELTHHYNSAAVFTYGVPEDNWPKSDKWLFQSTWDYPFLPDSHQLAASAVRPGMAPLSVWSPVQNLAYLQAKFWWMLSVPGANFRELGYQVEVHTWQGPSHFQVLQHLEKGRYAQVTFAATSSGRQSMLELYATGLTEARRAIVRRLVSELQWTDAPAAAVVRCDEKP